MRFEWISVEAPKCSFVKIAVAHRDFANFSNALRINVQLFSIFGF
jgi:hypothetical protein